jgi:hypothetical protein
VEAHYQQRPIALSWRGALDAIVFWNRANKRATEVREVS